MTDNVMTLHELCDTLGVSRRTIQGYEKHGLVRASGRNERGYLLYDAHAQEEIRQIRQLQLFGFPVKEIKAIRRMTNEELRRKLLEQRTVLEQKSAGLNEQLRRLSEMIEQLD